MTFSDGRNIMESPETSSRPPITPHLLALETNIAGLNTVVSKLVSFMIINRLTAGQSVKQTALVDRPSGNALV